MESFKYGSYNQKEHGMDEMLTPTDIQKHLKIGRNNIFIVKKWELYRNDITPLFLIK